MVVFPIKVTNRTGHSYIFSLIPLVCYINNSAYLMKIINVPHNVPQMRTPIEHCLRGVSQCFKLNIDKTECVFFQNLVTIHYDLNQYPFVMKQ